MEHQTRIDNRKEKLKKLLNTINFYEKDIIEALYKDFKKPPLEAFVTEIKIVTDDLKYTLKNLRK